MDLVFTQIITYENIISKELLSRAQTSSKNKNTVHYLVYYNTEEFAFLSIDRRPEISSLIIYEIYVLKPYRRKKLTRKILFK